MLRSKQTLALNLMEQGKNVFLTGDGGTGKTYIINEFKKYCDSTGIDYIVCAPTGIAALQVNGVTIHRVFRIPPRPLVEPVNSLPMTLKDIDVLIIEEISMVRIDWFDYIAKSIAILNNMRRRKGQDDLQVIVVGDFFQLPPVITDKDREILEQFKYGETLGRGYAFQSEYWDSFGFIPVMLDEIVRQTDVEFIENLNKVRRGDMTGLRYFNKNSKKAEIEKAILLCGTNKAVNEKNDIEYKKIHTPEKIYTAKITGEVKESDKMVPDELKLKIGCRVMTVVNDSDEKYSNGTLGTVSFIRDGSVDIITDDGIKATIEPYTWSMQNYKAEQTNQKVKVSMETIGSFTQLPLKLAYAVTIHKSQGQTFDKVNLDPYCWDCGQLYVALSRVRTIDGLHLTQLIQPRYLVASRDVKQFYLNL